MVIRMVVENPSNKQRVVLPTWPTIQLPTGFYSPRLYIICCD